MLNSYITKEDIIKSTNIYIYISLTRDVMLMSALHLRRCLITVCFNEDNFMVEYSLLHLQNTDVACLKEKRIKFSECLF